MYFQSDMETQFFLLEHVNKFYHHPGVFNMFLQVIVIEFGNHEGGRCVGGFNQVSMVYIYKIQKTDTYFGEY